MQKGNSLSRLGKKQEAILSYSKALEINANLADGWVKKADALYDLGKLQDTVAVDVAH